MSILNDIVTTPIYECVQPSTGKTLKFRPFVVKEERALLMAQESEDTTTMLNTLVNITRGCIIGPVPELSTFDIEYLFVQIRMKSVDENSMLVFTCSSCSEKTGVNIPLKNVRVHTPEGHEKIIKFDDTLAMEMRYPTFEQLESNQDLTSGIAASIKSIYKGDEIIDVSGLTLEEVVFFIDNKLNSKQFARLKNFYESIPETRLELEWKCPKCGQVHTPVLKGLNSFF